MAVYLRARVLLVISLCCVSLLWAFDPRSATLTGRRRGLPLLLPLRITPVVSDTYTVDWNDSIPLVYAASMYEDSYVVLLGQGVVTSDAEFCLIGEQCVDLAFSDARSYLPGVGFFGCLLPSALSTNAQLTIQTKSGFRVPSLVELRHLDTRQPAVAPRFQFCIVMQVKDMAPFFEDWLQYHRKVGFDHVYVYDNNSTDELHAFSSRADVEVIRWPWRRSQLQAYTHAALQTRSRCVWTMFMDLDEYVFPRSSSSVSEIFKKYAKKNVGQLHFASLRMSHGNITNCPTGPVPEVYTLRRVDAWEKNPKSAIKTSFMRGLHLVHVGRLSYPLESSYVDQSDAYLVHYSDRCWKEYYKQKFLGRNGVPDWKIPAGTDERTPSSSFWKLGTGAMVNDTSFRDFKRLVANRRISPPKLV